MNGKVFLKVKIKSLAEEARIIRREEKDARNSYFRSMLHSHRVENVRDEARAAQIAYGYLRGRRYREIEPNAKKDVPWVRVKKLVEKYGEVWNWGEHGGDYRRSDESYENKKRIQGGLLDWLSERKAAA